MPELGRHKLGHPATRLVAEFAVIVIGVLLALAVDAAWASRQETVRLEVYLGQLEADLRATGGSLDSTIALDSAVEASAVKLEEGINARPLAAADSLAAWLVGTMDASMFSPRSGTLQALVRSGDIRLVSDATLHAAILNYLNAVELTDRHLSGHVTTAIEAFGRLGNRINFATAVGTETPPDWVALSQDPGVTSDVRLMAISARYRLELLHPLRGSQQRLLEALEQRSRN